MPCNVCKGTGIVPNIAHLVQFKVDGESKYGCLITKAKDREELESKVFAFLRKNNIKDSWFCSTVVEVENDITAMFEFNAMGQK